MSASQLIQVDAADLARSRALQSVDSLNGFSRVVGMTMPSVDLPTAATYTYLRVPYWRGRYFLVQAWAAGANGRVVNVELDVGFGGTPSWAVVASWTLSNQDAWLEDSFDMSSAPAGGGHTQGADYRGLDCLFRINHNSNQDVHSFVFREEDYVPLGIEPASEPLPDYPFGRHADAAAFNELAAAFPMMFLIGHTTPDITRIHTSVATSTFETVWTLPINSFSGDRIFAELEQSGGAGGTSVQWRVVLDIGGTQDVLFTSALTTGTSWSRQGLLSASLSSLPNNGDVVGVGANLLVQAWTNSAGLNAQVRNLRLVNGSSSSSADYLRIV